MERIEDRLSHEIVISQVYLDSSMPYAEFSVIDSDPALLYQNYGGAHAEIVVCVNAGHGTRGGASAKTQCHPDGSAKVTGGSTAAGATMATAVSGGMTFLDGTAEADVTLAQAVILRDVLLDEGYSVLMIREGEDVQLDNLARTVLANEYADCHIALHWDSSATDKGAFYCSVPNVASYRGMEPVASTWAKSHRFGDCVIEGLRGEGTRIYGNGAMAIDLTQTSYSSIPSIDLELGDKLSDHSDDALQRNAKGIAAGIAMYFP